jgi:two-component system, LuxR family, sensor kinase FixL
MSGREPHVNLDGSRELVEAIFSFVRDSIAVTNLQGDLVKVSRGTLINHGYESESDLLGKSALVLISEPDREKALRNMSLTLEKGIVENEEYQLLRKDGSTFPGELTANIMYDSSGSPSGFVAVVKDITERKKSEEKLRRLYDAVNTAAIGLAGLDELGNLSFVNESFKHMWGYEEHEILGRDISSFFQDDGKELLTKKIALEKTNRQFHAELLARRKDGVDFIVMAYMAPFRESEGLAKGYFCSFIDVSGTKWLERELYEKIRDMETFGHIVAHDLKTPLITIMEFSRLLGEQLAGKLNDEEKDIVRRIVTSSSDSIAMIEDLRKYYFIDREEDRLEEVDIRLIISQVLAALEGKNLLAAAKITIEPEKIIITWKPTAIYHIFHNLLENAVKFGARNITISYEKREKAHRFLIKDDGWGIENYFVEKVFDVFSRSPSARKSSVGTGIGLAIVKRLIEKHGGKISVESRKGEGSTFIFEIPVIYMTIYDKS